MYQSARATVSNQEPPRVATGNADYYSQVQALYAQSTPGQQQGLSPAVSAYPVAFSSSFPPQSSSAPSQQPSMGYGGAYGGVYDYAGYQQTPGAKGAGSGAASVMYDYSSYNTTGGISSSTAPPR